MRRVYSDARGQLDRLARSDFDSASWQTVCIKAHLLSLGGAIDELQSLDQLKAGRIQVLPHQIDAVMTAVNRMHCRAILADEVGLGKTIEAGLILKEYLVRNLVKTVLILTPAPLTTQWRGEMESKFGEAFVVADKDDDETFKGWAAHDRLIVSLDTAKHPGNAKEIAGRKWDMLVVDEAHRLKNSQTAAYQFVKTLDARFKLFLTATPIQNSLFELYNLVELLSEGMFGSLESFRARFVEDARGRVLKNPQALSELLARVMIRHRRSEVGIKFVDRKVETVRLQGSPDERRLHDAVVEYVAKGLGTKEAKGQKTLAFIRLSRMLSSSPQALAKSAETMATHTTLEEGEDLGRIASLARSIPGSSKLDALRSVLSKVQDKAIVFTGFYETQDFLAERLRADGLKVVTFNGRMSQKEKDRIIAEFKMSADVLICTDAGSEGVNLQFCHVLVNYDLPWNPMRVEQRIGRVHRIGQTRDVLIINLSIQGTIEDYVLQILEQKIELFTQAVGDTDLILSNLKGSDSFEKTIITLIAQAKERGALEAGFETLGRNLEMAKAAADQIREFDSQTLALLDLSAIQAEASAS